ncbi:MAG: bile acid:sodium symporter [Lentimonas sp.]
MTEQLKKHGFNLCLLLAIGLAIAFPQPASIGGLLHAEFLTKVGVTLIFFLLGLSIPSAQLGKGYKPVRLHGFVLIWNYVGFPLVTGGLLLVLGQFIADDFRLGFWLLAIMPTTIASAVAFTDLAAGATSNAIFAAVLSNVLSVLIVPIVAMCLLSVQTGVTIELTPLLIKIFLLILLPLLVGQVFQKFTIRVATAIAPIRKPLSSAIILFIVHAAFAQSVESNALSQYALGDFMGISIFTVILLLLVNALVWWSCRFFKYSRAQGIAAFYCASQKSLATGLPLAVMILAATPTLGDSALLVIPMILYHPLQLVLAGIVNSQLGAKSNAASMQ